MTNFQIFLLSSTLLVLSNAVFTNQGTNFLAPDVEANSRRIGSLHVHIVPHTHNDAGWLFTADSYFQGNQRGCVNRILDNVVDALQKNPDRRFVYVEQIFFTKWWEKQSEEKKQEVKQLVKEGRLELLNGGWVMNDEACTYYDDIIEQMTLGHRFIKSEFDQVPRAGWQIDTFGHSAGQAKLASEMGFDAMFMERIDYEDFNNRVKTGGLEMIWRPEGSQKSQDFLLAHVNYMKYYLAPAPFGYCITMLCSASESQAPAAAEKYANWIKNQSSAYPTKHILHQIGGDFEWSYPDSKYQSLEIIIDYLNQHPELGVTAQFSTPTEYTKAVFEEVKNNRIHLAEKTDDFFPYRDEPHAYWTGYFTSKPWLKGMIRQASRYLQTVKKLLSKLYFKDKVSFSDLNEATLSLEKGISMLQHHDAITGTAKRAVDLDYENTIAEGHNSIHQLLESRLTELFEERYNHKVQPFVSLNSFVAAVGNHSQYDLTGDGSLVAYVYNPSRVQDQVLKFTVPDGSFTLKDEHNQAISYDLICDEDSSHQSTVCKIYFAAQVGTNNLKPFFFVETEDQKNKLEAESLSIEQDNPIDLFNDEKLIIKSGAKVFEYITADGESHSFTLDYGYYKSYRDNGQHSGAYIFRPDGNLTEYSQIEEMSIKKGSQVIEVTIVRGSLVTRLRFYNDKEIHETIEIDTRLGPIPVDSDGKEVVIKVSNTRINNQGVFYTDANGLEMQKRTFNQNVDHLGGNYYPVTSAIYIEDSKAGGRVTLMNDRSQGGSSLEDGSLELMINRRILADDDRGVEEPLNSDAAVQTKHWLIFSQGSQSQRSLQYNLDTQPIVYLSKTTAKVDSLESSSTEAENKEIDENLVKFYIRIYSENEILVRLHNLQEDASVSVDLWDQDSGKCFALKELLGDSYEQIKVKEIKEVTLTTTLEKQEMLKTKINWDRKYKCEPKEESLEKVSLAPLEERVFVLSL